MPVRAAALKKALLGLLALLLVLPAVQAKWHLLPVRPLHGYNQSGSSHPVFSWQNLWDNSFQDQLDGYLTDHLGLRE